MHSRGDGRGSSDTPVDLWESVARESQKSVLKLVGSELE